ncbi:S8 family peptidase [Marixanthomonas ophiurae]|uniref:S8 family peptidase n=1 Tax=Marixanthomonas ophiurae TaxID=387659 RepID=UPI001313FF39|nr:S8 family serine peptidase [Marixanthomonas ophiurae]
MSQEKAWMYLRAQDSLFAPKFSKVDDHLVYDGNDTKLKNILQKYKIFEFKKTFKKATNKNLKKTFFVIADKKTLLTDLLQKTNHLFESGELIAPEDKKIFEPNDYGLTSTIGANKGVQVNLDYFDFLKVPKAWYYTTGSRGIVVGIADASVDTTNAEFKGKTKVFRASSLSKGHGNGVAGITAAQGDNGYGVPGVCYDCSIYATDYGHFKDLNQLLELSRAGAKVINCSWVSTRFYQTAQDAIDEMYNNGTIIVAAAGNADWSKTKGEKLYYPASYNHVISVASISYKHETIEDHTLLSKTGNYYGENIRGYLGRTLGFKDKEALTGPYNYPVSLTTLNSEVDLVAPSSGQFRISKWMFEDEIEYIWEASSPTAPLVTGTIGLMYSLYPCLPTDEVESILKLSAWNIDSIGDNMKYKGNYGAGALQTGDAVEMIYQMVSDNETVTIDNQNFSRSDFKLTTYSKKTILKDQQFTDAAMLNLTSKNQIVLSENTVLKPNAEGSIHLKIDPTLEKGCDLQLRDPSILKK